MAAPGRLPVKMLEDALEVMPDPVAVTKPARASSGLEGRSGRDQVAAGTAVGGVRPEQRQVLPDAGAGPQILSPKERIFSFCSSQSTTYSALGVTSSAS